jgi:glycosyltransferase involved in cell wall biosynthesis
MSKQSMVSVIIPVYNSAQCISRAIDSVLAQTVTDYEIIIVDDGSTDNTTDVIRQYGSKVNYIHQDNAGVSVARNVGIAAAKGQWIAFLDADDEWLPSKLEMQMELLTRNPDLRWCGSNRYQSDGKRRATVVNAEAIEEALREDGCFENYFIAARQGLCTVQASVVVIQRCIFERLGGFEPGRVHAEDFDMWLRIGHNYPKIGFIAEPLVVMHLDVANPEFTARRLGSKRGENERVIVARHLKLARELGTFSEFRPIGLMILRKSLLMAIYHGYKADAREIVINFKDMFPLYLQLVTHLLTIFPRLTSRVLHGVAYVGYRLGFEKQVTRRWTYSKVPERAYK